MKEWGRLQYETRGTAAKRNRSTAATISNHTNNYNGQSKINNTLKSMNKDKKE